MCRLVISLPLSRGVTFSYDKIAFSSGVTFSYDEIVFSLKSLMLFTEDFTAFIRGYP